jgi:hypothetical protein
VSFQITILKVLAGHPGGRASVADLTRYVSILVSSGSDWSSRMKRLAQRAPDLDIFGKAFVLRNSGGWQITDGGREFLASLEAPFPTATLEPVEIVVTVATSAQPCSTPPRIRLVVDNSWQRDQRIEPLTAIGLVFHSSIA